MDNYLSLTEKGKDAYIDALDKAGWFTVPQNNKEALVKNLKSIDNNMYLALGLAHISFDAEGFDEADDYRRLLDEIARLAGFAVVSSEFEYSYSEEGDSFAGTVTTANNTYNFEFDELFGEWYHPDFTEFLNENLLPGEGIESRFFDLPGLDQGVGLVFVPQALYDKVIEEGIIPYAGYFVENFE